MQEIHLRVRPEGRPKAVEAGKPLRQGETLAIVQANTAAEARVLLAQYFEAKALEDQGELKVLRKKDPTSYLTMLDALDRVTYV